MPAIEPTHPGEILREEFLKPMGISAYRLAKEISVPVNRITAITKEQRDITPETALLLSKFFGVDDALWLNLQRHYDLERTRDALADRLKNISTWNSTGNHPQMPNA